MDHVETLCAPLCQPKPVIDLIASADLMVLSAWAGNDACASRRVINTADGALDLFRYQDRLNQFDFDIGASRDFCAVEAFLPMRD